MHLLIMPAILTLAGTYFLIRNVYYLRNDEALEKYILTTPKAKLWLKKFGQDKTMEYSRKYFLPIGIVVSLALLSMGVWGLWQLAPLYLT